MHFRITSDANESSGVGEVVGDISGPTRWHFEPKDYGPGVSGIGVVLMCRDPYLKFKRRIRFVKKDKKTPYFDKTLYMDIMLDFPQMLELSHEQRKAVIIERLCNEIPTILRKYAFKEFDEPRFVDDLKNWLLKGGIEAGLPEYNRLVEEARAEAERLMAEVRKTNPKARGIPIGMKMPRFPGEDPQREWPVNPSLSPRAPRKRKG